MPAGRPTKYRKEMAAQVAEMGTGGEGLCEIAAELGIHYQTFLDWQAQHPEFSEAVKVARRNSQAWWERQGRLGIFGGTEGFNATGYIFQMKNRFPDDWRDRQEVNHSGGVTVQVVDGFHSDTE